MIDVRIAADQIETRLRDQIPVNLMQGFRSEIDEEIETPPNDPRVKAYWVLYCGPGKTNGDRGLVPGTFVASLNFQVTVAAGTEDRALFGVEQVRAALVGHEIADVGLISEDEMDLGPLRVDRGANPPRPFAPLQFRLEP